MSSADSLECGLSAREHPSTAKGQAPVLLCTGRAGQGGLGRERAAHRDCLAQTRLCAVLCCAVLCCSVSRTLDWALHQARLQQGMDAAGGPLLSISPVAGNYGTGRRKAAGEALQGPLGQQRGRGRCRDNSGCGWRKGGRPLVLAPSHGAWR